ncbi:MAG: hypothetical protein J0H40_13410 [Rhizobiales bacterium]|nr:hypothetical protein [Hyphomicrobiales bacterium]
MDADFADCDLSDGDVVAEISADGVLPGDGFAADVLATTISVSAAEATGATIGDGDEGVFADNPAVFGKSAFGKSVFESAVRTSVFDALVSGLSDVFGASEAIAGNAATVVVAADEGERDRAVACDGGALSGAGDEGVACGELNAASFCEDRGSFGAALFRLMEPVTESSPCSRTVIRVNSRSRSLFKVSMAEARRLVSFSLALATD